MVKTAKPRRYEVLKLLSGPGPQPTQREMGEMLGVSYGRVSRFLAQLQDEGLIVRAGRARSVVVIKRRA